MLADALEFPRTSDDWLATILIGGVLSLLSVLIVPAVLVNGYLLRVVRAAVADEETAPVFEDWVELFVDGLLVWVVQFVFIGVPTLVLSLVVAGAFGAGAVGRGVGMGLVLIAAIPVVVAGYVLPAALANFARTGEFTAAFHLRTVARGALTADYLVAIVLVIAVSLVLGFIGGLLTIVLVGFFVLFYLQLVIYHLIGQGFARGLGLEAPAEGPVQAAG